MLSVYENLLSLEKRYLTGREIARLLNIKDKNRRVTLTRLVNRNILRRVRRNLYEVAIRPSDILEISNVIYQPSYLSFMYCLGTLGIIDQIPYEIEFATPKKTKRVEMRGRSVVFRKIKRELFFGYLLKDKMFIAEPEKALLDTLYLASKGLAELNKEALNLSDLSREKFIKMSRRFAPSVQEEAKLLAKNMKRK